MSPYTIGFLFLPNYVSKNRTAPSAVGLALVIIYVMLIFCIFSYSKILGYSMISFIAAENPEISARKAMCLSKKMCKGCRENILVMHLSFVLWAIFCLVTLGFGYILVMPYFKNTYISMYEAVKKNAIDSNVLSEEDFYVLQ